MVANGWLVAEVPRMDHGGSEGEIRFFTKEGVVHMFMGEYLSLIHISMKVLKPEFSADTNFIRKFQREAQAAAGLAHPNVVNAVSYTHLDVYKRQVPMSIRILQTICTANLFCLNSAKWAFLMAMTPM